VGRGGQHQPPRSSVGEGHGRRYGGRAQRQQHIVLAGWARPQDITAENEVLSSRLAQAKIDYYGSGVIGMKQFPGWGYWLLDWVWPF